MCRYVIAQKVENVEFILRQTRNMESRKAKPSSEKIVTPYFALNTEVLINQKKKNEVEAPS